MTTRHAAPRPTPIRADLGSGVARSLMVLPSAVVELALVARGDPDGASRRAGGVADRGPASVVVLVHALLSGVLGAAIWFLTGLALLGAARGPLYGFVDPGPYDHSWGGPTLAGAWTVHALVWLAVLPAWGLLTWALTGLRHAVTRRLLDGVGSRWVLPVTLLVVLGLLLFARAWVHQL